MPRVSVVLPIYNVQSYLAECLDSLLEQDVHDFEAILIDDGSTDPPAGAARRNAHASLCHAPPPHQRERSGSLIRTGPLPRGGA